MSSQTTEAPHCSDGHGLMVPTRSKFGYMPGADGVITAVAEWSKGDNGMEVHIDSVDEATAEFLRSVTDGDDLGEWIDKAMNMDGTLRPYFDFLNVAQGLYRIDDSRPGCNHTYNIWFGDGAPEGFALLPETVYRYFGPDEEVQGPPLTSFDDVVALMDDLSALTVDDTTGVNHKKTDDPLVMAKWDLKDRVVVWNMTEIQRHLTEADSEEEDVD